MHPEKIQPYAATDHPEPQSRTPHVLATGIEAFDRRFGGIVRGRHYLLSGSPGAGKSTAALHFIGAGLEAGQACAVLTQDDPEDLLAQAAFIGYDFRTAAGQDRLAVLQYRLDFPRNYSRAADPARVFSQLRDLVQEVGVERFVIDSIFPFLEGGRATNQSLDEFPEFLDSLSCTSYLTIPGDLNDGYYRRIYDRLIAGAAGLFHLEAEKGQVRQFTVRKLRQPTKSLEPFQFVIRAGTGMVEHEPESTRHELSDEVRRRVVLLALPGSVPEEVMMTLRERYELVEYPSAEAAFGELVEGHFGALLIAMNPREAESVFAFTRQLRRAGNGAPVLFISPHAGLRGSTRARGLQAGGDDFLTDVLTPEEFLGRLEGARVRGHRRNPDVADLEKVELQPENDAGEYLLLDEANLRRIVREKLQGRHPYFALVMMPPSPSPAAAGELWRLLAARLRVPEGDLGARLDDGRIAIYLRDVRRRHVDDLLARLANSEPGLQQVSSAVVLPYPGDRADVEAWAGAGGVPVAVTPVAG
jgi:KaiC/GvpD/RAD55 family RecA-like ATPase/CheY-like chemotaxis protein